MTAKNKEEWRPIPGYSAYEASSSGRIRRILPGKNTYPGRINKVHKNSSGYMQVWLARDDGAKRNFSVHRLVAAAFFGPIPHKMEVDHIDDNRTNNAVDNLRIVTSSENTSKAYARGRMVNNRGENYGAAKLTNSDVIEIRRRCASGEAQSKIAKDYGICRQNVSCIYTRKSWGHI